ncbi:hypothetical protein G7046_g1496 [Stylonectria norvegica]|nr:hypothetical protein G7046_g1496 [Stylonectria norvegica]
MASTICAVPDGYPAEIIGYADPWIASPGDQVSIKVSSTASKYSHRTVRLIQGLDVPHAPEVRMEDITEINSGSSQGRFQRAHPGSYAIVDNLGVQGQDEGLSLSLYVQPYLVKPGHDQALVSLLDDNLSAGISILIDEQGHIKLRVGDGDKLQEIKIDYTLTERQWLKLDVTVQGSSLKFSLEPCTYLGQRVGQNHFQVIDIGKPIVLPSPGRLSLAATQPRHDAIATDHFNGRIDNVRVFALGKNPREIINLDFRLKISTDEIVDVSPYKNNGVLINAPTRAIPGHDWDGSETDWTKTSYGYGAIHFHEDDLDDAKWDTDFTITLPTGAQSGAYAVEVCNADDVSVKDYIVFFVRPNLKSTTAKLALVLSTFTYTAYANERMYDETKSSHLAPSGNFEPRPADEDFLRMERRSDLGLSLYDVHRDGTGNVFSSIKRPILNVRPAFHHWALDRPREFSADLLMIGFMEKTGIKYDILTDHQLHEQGVKALEPYSTVITGSHPEYPSIESLNAYSGFAARGGSLLYLGGNGFYWRSVIDPANPHRMEVRRGDQGVRTYGLPGSERHHSLNGGRGGLWRSLGRAANYLFAVGCCGEGVGPGVPYARTTAGRDERYAWVFKGLAENELIGEHGFGGGASGDEIDRWDPMHGSPPDSVVLASSTGHPDEFILFPEDFGFQQTNITGTGTNLVRSDIVLYKTPGGGEVFSVGSMNWYNSVGWDGYDNSVAKVTENVIRKFLDNALEQ